MSKEDDGTLVMTYGCAACFSAEDDGTVTLPFDLETGELVDDVWERWLAWDPVRMVPRHADALRGLRAIYIDAGTRDEWYLDLGAKAMVRRAGRDRRHRRLLRAVRRHAHGDRVPLPDWPQVPRRAALALTAGHLGKIRSRP